MFGTSDYWDADNGWFENDYHLLPISPCVDAGDPSYQTEPNATDLDGNPRIIGDRVDIGAYEAGTRLETKVFVVPRVINQASRGNYVIAILYLPDGVQVGDIVDGSFGLYVDGSGDGVGADRQVVIGGGNVGRMFVVFDRAAVIEAVSGQSSAKVYIAGELESGECIYGSDTIRVVRAQRRVPRRASGGRVRGR
jgi:hypothetical protein